MERWQNTSYITWKLHKLYKCHSVIGIINQQQWELSHSNLCIQKGSLCRQSTNIIQHIQLQLSFISKIFLNTYENYGSEGKVISQTHTESSLLRNKLDVEKNSWTKTAFLWRLLHSLIHKKIKIKSSALLRSRTPCDLTKAFTVQIINNY